MMFRSLRVGLFLTIRYILRGSPWSSVLIVAIMFLTFLNVVVVRGVLVGLPIGASISYEAEYSGSVIVTPRADERHINRSRVVEEMVRASVGYEAHTARYLAGAVVRANYARPQSASRVPNQIGTTVVGIAPEVENRVTRLATRVVEGRYLTNEDTTAVLVGSQLLDRYAGNTPDSGGTPETSSSLRGVYPGDKVRITLAGVVGEYEVAGVVKGKVGENSRRVFMHEDHLRKVLGRSTDKKDEMAIMVRTGVDADVYVGALRGAVGGYAVVQTSREAQGQFLDDIARTFDILGNGIGFVGIVVAAITVFIMIFIVALNRQKQIGILKGIGVNRLAIESSYVFLSLFYACLGITLGTLVLYLGVAPYVEAHPINFPFADGVLVAPWNDTMVRSGILVLTTLLAGYIPARMIVQKSTINAILGR